MTEIKFSHHARVRQEQREISTTKVLRAIEGNEKTTDTYKDEVGTTEIYNGDTKVVVSEDNTVVTVVENGRNTRYDVSRRSKSREEFLLRRIRQRPSDDNALCSLADLKLSGELGPINTTEAFDLFKKAADLGSGHAMMRIALMYEEGHLKTDSEPGIPSLRFHSKAMYWMEKSAKTRNKAGMAFYGQTLCIKAARLMPEDSEEKSAIIEQAMYYLHEASRMNATRATYQLAEAYEKGYFEAKNLNKAMAMYLRAAKIGSPSSIDKMFEFSREGLYDGVEFEELFDSVIKSWARNSIGLAYGKGVETCEGTLGKHPLKGVHMLEMAAQQGHEEAMKRVAKEYTRRWYLKNSLVLAQYWNCERFKLLTQSAASGNFLSLWLLGMMHLKGKAGKFSLKEAEKCLRTAAEGMRSSEHFLELAKLYKTGRLGNIDPDVGNVYVKKAIQIIEKEGEEMDFEWLGTLFSTGEWLNQDFKKADDWLQRTSELSGIGAKIKILMHPQSPLRDTKSGVKLVLKLIERGIEAFYICTKYWSRLKRDVEIMAFASNPTAKKTALRILIRHAANKVPYHHELLKDFNDISSGEYLLGLYSRKELSPEYHETLRSWGNNLRGSYNGKNLCLVSTMFTNGMLSVDRCEELKVFLCYAGLCKDSPEELKRLLSDYQTVKERAIEELAREIQDLQREETRDPSEKRSFIAMTRVLGDVYEADNQLAEAVKWFEKSSRLNNSKACGRLAAIYDRNGDLNKALKWYTRGAVLGNGECEILLEAYYDRGYFTDKRVFKHFEHTTIVDDFKLSKVEGLYGLTVYPQTRDDMYKEAMYRLTLGNEQDKQRGVFWLRKATRGGHLESTVELYRLYSTGAMGNCLKSIAKQHQYNVYKTISSKLKRATSRDDLRRFSTALSVMPKVRQFKRLEKKTKKLLGKFKGRTISLAKNLDAYKFIMPFEK